MQHTLHYDGEKNEYENNDTNWSQKVRSLTDISEQSVFQSDSITGTMAQRPSHDL